MAKNVFSILVAIQLFVVAHLGQHVHGYDLTELSAAYADRMSRLSVAEVSLRVSCLLPDLQKDREYELAYLLQTIKKNDELLRAIRGQLGPTSSIEDVENFIRGKFADQENIEKESSYEGEYTLTAGPNYQVVKALSAKKLAEKASERSTRLLQYGFKYDLLPEMSDVWLCLDERTMDGVTHIWSKSDVKIQCPVPPGFEQNSLQCDRQNLLGELWSSSNGPHVLGEQQTNATLVGAAHSDSGYLLASFGEHALDGFPEWIAEIGVLKESENTETKWEGAVEKSRVIEQLDDLKTQVNQLLKEAVFTCSPGMLCAQRLVSFKDVRGSGALIYPRTIRFLKVAHRRSSADTTASERPLGVIDICNLSVGNLLVGDDVPSVKKIPVENGMSYLNRDTNQGFIIGQTPEDQIVALASRNGAKKLFWIANVLLVLAIAVLWIKKATRPNVEP